MNTNAARTDTLEDLFGPVIFSYTRAQALADGVLVDVTETAREAGFRFPVALTAAVWADCVAWSNEQEKTHQDESGRLWDVLWMARNAIKRAPQGEDTLSVSLARIPQGCRRPKITSVKVVIGPGDAGEPVLTIMLPNED